MREVKGSWIGVTLMIGLLLTPAGALVAGDCSKARHRTEKMICGDAQLSIMDEMLERVVGDLKKKLSAKDWKEMAKDQGQWKKRRNGFLCPDVYTCMSTYNQRLIELKRFGDAVSSLNKQQQAMVTNVSDLLTKMEESWGVSDDDRITTLPNRGLRGLYLRSRLNTGTLKSWLGEEVFLSGPHKADGYDFKNKGTFGRYNPKFIGRLKKWLDFFGTNAIAQPLAQGFYDNQLLDIAPAYYRMYEYLNAPANVRWADDLLAKYKRAIKEGKGLFKGGYHYPYKEFRAVAVRLEREEGYNLYELTTAGPFWLRRRMDGSEKVVSDLLVQLLDSFEYLSDIGP